MTIEEFAAVHNAQPRCYELTCGVNHRGLCPSLMSWSLRRLWRRAQRAGLLR